MVPTEGVGIRPSLRPVGGGFSSIFSTKSRNFFAPRTDPPPKVVPLEPHLPPRALVGLDPGS